MAGTEAREAISAPSERRGNSPGYDVPCSAHSELVRRYGPK